MAAAAGAAVAAALAAPNAMNTANVASNPPVHAAPKKQPKPAPGIHLSTSRPLPLSTANPDD